MGIQDLLSLILYIGILWMELRQTVSAGLQYPIYILILSCRLTTMSKYTLEYLQTHLPSLNPSLRTAYDKHLLSPLWRRKKDKVHRRDGNRCQVCGDAKLLEVHHLTYERVFVEKLQDLVLLCPSCHRKVHRGSIEFDEIEDIATNIKT